jgi:hypothetical protein
MGKACSRNKFKAWRHVFVEEGFPVQPRSYSILTRNLDQFWGGRPTRGLLVICNRESSVNDKVNLYSSVAPRKLVEELN